MPDHVFGIIGSELERVDLASQNVLAEPGDPITHVYFPEASVVSLVAPMRDGREPEQATVGREGMIGALPALGSREAFSRWLVQIPGKALRCPARAFEAAFYGAPGFRKHIVLYLQLLHAQVAQSVACNAVHPVEARAARWILAMRDRSDSDEMPLTQEFLAQILSVHRSSVTLTMNALQNAGYIRTRRALVCVTDRKGLESVTCECYRLVRDYFELILPGLFDPHENSTISRPRNAGAD